MCISHKGYQSYIYFLHFLTIIKLFQVVPSCIYLFPSLIPKSKNSIPKYADIRILNNHFKIYFLFKFF